MTEALLRLWTTNASQPPQYLTRVALGGSRAGATHQRGEEVLVPEEALVGPVGEGPPQGLPLVEQGGAPLGCVRHVAGSGEVQLVRLSPRTGQ
jgi:hypothetical protein